MASTYLTKTFSSSQTNAKKGTISFWFKLAANDSSNSFYRLFATGADTVNRSDININHPVSSTGVLNIVYFNTSSQDDTLTTTRTFRDFNAWYHLVIAYDTTQSTASNRIKLYVNGVQETSFSTENYPEQNDNLHFGNNSSAHHIGNSPHYNPRFFSGAMSHFHYCDGYTYAASDFGSTDATTGEWKINTSPNVQYGNNGFFILKNGNSVTDQSGNGNNFTVSGGTLTKTEDCPSNVFATMNSLNYTSSAIAYANGNTKPQYPGSWIASLGTLGAKAGKYYWEAKVASGNNQNLFYGISTAAVDLDTSPQNKAGVISQHINGDRYVDTTYTASAAEALTNGDILGVALDLDSGTKTVKFYKNGSLLTSSSSVNLTSTFDDEFIFPIFIGNNSSASSAWEVNFGNGYFGTTAVSSAGTNASNLGIFEYDVPSGYTALCTKGLNE